MAPSRAQRQCGWRDWASLDSGPAGLVAEHVLRNDLVDLIRFRAACRPWRACSAHLRAQGVLNRQFLPRSWIMLPRKFNKLDDRRRFLNVSTGESIYRSLSAHDPWSNYLVGTTHEGLVLLLSSDIGQLLNPLTGQVTGLPNRFPITSILPLAGRVYCATSRNVSLVQTATTANQPPKLVEAVGHELHKEFGSVAAFKDQLYEGRSRMFLVENNGELILCHRATRTDEKYSVSVHLMNMNAKNLVPLHGLNGKALFLGKRRSVLVATRVSPSINTAYFCWPRSKDVLVYAVDLLGGGCVEAKFEKVDAAYYLSCYVSDHSSE
ncbi:hypothetical protein VPH35_106361 [Triticum aestivum]